MVSNILNFHPYLGRFPFWLIFFNWVETTNQPTFFGILVNLAGKFPAGWLWTCCLPENRPKRRFGSPRAFSIVRWGQGIGFFPDQTKIVSFKGWTMMKPKSLVDFGTWGPKWFRHFFRVLPKDWKCVSMYVDIYLYIYTSYMYRSIICIIFICTEAFIGWSVNFQPQNWTQESFWRCLLNYSKYPPCPVKNGRIGLTVFFSQAKLREFLTA